MLPWPRLMSWAAQGSRRAVHELTGSRRRWQQRSPFPIVDVQFAGVAGDHGDRSVSRPTPAPADCRSAAWFASAAGERRAVVAMPTTLLRTDVAGMLAAHGLEADATNRGRDAIDLAHRAADLEMIFVDMDILVPDVRQVLYELRIEPSHGRNSDCDSGGRRPARQRPRISQRTRPRDCRRRGPIRRKSSPESSTN